jgi:HlyD family secretion protein
MININERVKLRRSIRAHLIAALATVLVVACGLGGWATVTELSGAVIAVGQLVVDSNVKKVQHLTGGIVAQLNVHEGSHVNEGDIVLRLDDTQTRANLSIVTKSLDELTARKAREEAEQSGADDLTFPPELLARNDDPDVKRIVVGEQKLFEIRRSGREGQKAQFRERIAQLNDEILGNTAQTEAKASEIQWISKELDGVRDLWSRNLVQFTRLTTLERDAARVQGERDNLVATVAQLRGKIAETQLQILQVDQDMRTEVGKDLADIRAKIAELAEKQIAAEDQLKRVDLRAPQSGTVQQLEIHTVGGVITAGQAVMLIVPDQDKLVVEARIMPQEIDQLRIGQPAIVRFTSFNQRTTPELNGTVSVIAADVVQDERTNSKYYTIRINVPDEEIARLGDHKLIAGMPVDAFVQTANRTVFSYLVRPFHDQLMRAFRDR